MPLPLIGRRVHISGSIHKNPEVAPLAEVEAAREFVRELVVALLKDGATFVVPVDAESTREADGLPFCFDWLVLETIGANLHLAMNPERANGEPLILAVQHAKNVDQIPAHRQELWDRFTESEVVAVENAGHWNMNSKRLEIQSQHGDILIVLGGEEGVLHLANLYHSTGKPVIPLPFAIHEKTSGARRLWDAALVGNETDRFFAVTEGQKSHYLLNKLNFAPRKSAKDRAEAMMFVLRALRKPRVFAVRLLNPEHEQFKAVDDFFEAVVKPVVEEFGYDLKTVNGRNVEESLIELEIFQNLHYGWAVVADITGERPNCFIELGYALGQGYPVMICGRKGVRGPFDIAHIPSHDWESEPTIEERRRLFRDYWKANIRRPPLVRAAPLVP
jgi:hypothetical protein